MLIERLTEAADHMSAKDYNAIAFDFRCSADVFLIQMHKVHQ